MRCVACNCSLTDYEATRKGAATGEYLDLCDDCFRTIANDVVVITRADLMDNLDELEGDMDVEGESKTTQGS